MKVRLTGIVAAAAEVDRLRAPPEAIINASKAAWLEIWAKEITPLSKR